MLLKAQAEIDDLENLAVTSPWYPNIPDSDEDYEQDGEILPHKPSTQQEKHENFS